MKDSELFLMLMLVALIVWVALREPSQTIIVFIPTDRQPNMKQANVEVLPETIVKTKFHGFATA
jgi:hypothetical protein